MAEEQKKLMKTRGSWGNSVGKRIHRKGRKGREALAKSVRRMARDLLRIESAKAGKALESYYRNKSKEQLAELPMLLKKATQLVVMRKAKALREMKKTAMQSRNLLSSAIANYVNAVAEMENPRASVQRLHRTIKLLDSLINEKEGRQ